MLTIRLQRSGKKNKPEFRIVLAQKTAAAGKKFVEVLGHYNPRSKVFGVKSEDRLKYWIAQHVEISPTVHNLLVGKNLLDLKKVRAFKVPKKEVAPVVAETSAPAAPAAPEMPAVPEGASSEVVEQPPVQAEAPAAAPVEETPVAPEAEPAA